MSQQLQSVPASQATATGTWSAAYKWVTAAGQFEQGKLYCQVMAGFELLALKKLHGIDHGNNQHEGRTSHDGKSTPVADWETLLKQHTGLSQSTAYRFMDMAKAAAPRLKKLAVLNDFSPGAQPFAQLEDAKKDALEAVVKKLTDGVTQKEFGESLGLWKKPQGSGATGRKPGDGGRKKLSLAEQAELLKLQAVEDWRSIASALSVYQAKFTASLSDTDITAQIAVLEQALTARRAWLKQPLNGRDPKAIHALFA